VSRYVRCVKRAADDADGPRFAYEYPNAVRFGPVGCGTSDRKTASLPSRPRGEGQRYVRNRSNLSRTNTYSVRVRTVGKNEASVRAVGIRSNESWGRARKRNANGSGNSERCRKHVFRFGRETGAQLRREFPARKIVALHVNGTAATVWLP